MIVISISRCAISASKAFLSNMFGLALGLASDTYFLLMMSCKYDVGHPHGSDTYRGCSFTNPNGQVF
jgi:hypothetical protein